MIILNKDNTKLCYMDTDSFVFNIFPEDKNNYVKNDRRPLQIGVDKNLIGMFKDELRGKMMKKFCALRTKTCTLMEDNSEMKELKQ